MDNVPSIISQLRSEEEQGILTDKNICENISHNSSEKSNYNTNDDFLKLDHIRQVFQNLNEPIFFQNGNHQIKWMNPEVKRKFPTEKEITNSPCHVSLFNNSTPCAFCPMKKAIETKRSSHITVNIDSLGLCNITSIPLFSNQKLFGVIQQINVIDKVPESKELCKHDILQTQESIIDNAALGIIVLNRDFQHLTVNPAFSGMTGFGKTELKNKTEYPSYWPERFTEDIKIEIQRLQKKGQIKMETYFQRKDKSIFPVSIVGSTFIDNDSNEEHMILIIDDITKSKATERELKISQLLLLSLVQNLEKKVQDRTQKIEQLLKQKNEFINQLGHDLKNPLGPLINLLPLLLNDENDPKKKQMLNVILRNTNHMRNLITKTIELARLNSGNIKLNFEEINLNTAFNDSLVRNNHLLEEKQMEIENNLPPDVIVNADKIRVEELFDNILTNAIKYSYDGGKIIINGSVTETTVTISIKDHGIGMSKDQIAHVFDEFYKADPSRHDFKSSGLGTSIIKRIVEKHGGHIKIESDGLNKGATVIFTIQKNPPELTEQKKYKKIEKLHNINLE